MQARLAATHCLVTLSLNRKQAVLARFGLWNSLPPGFSGASEKKKRSGTQNQRKT
jgi:hypothetical protein